MYEGEYRSKFMTPAAAVELIPARGTLSMGMAISEPRALQAALEDRVKRGAGLSCLGLTRRTSASRSAAGY